MMSRPENRVLRRPAVERPQYRLACFHHAGGGAGAFAPWLRRLPADVELVALRLPGRESRLAETPYTDASAAVAECVEILRPLVYDEVPLAYFGHSMGGILAHETYRALAAEGAPPPLFLAVSAALAPHVQATRGARLPAGYDRGTLRGLLRDFAGTEPALLADDELVELVLPSLEADLLLLDGYRPALPLELVGCPLLTFAGDDDPVVPAQGVSAWQAYAGGPYAHRLVRAGHFFVGSHADQILGSLDAWARAAMPSVRPVAER